MSGIVGMFERGGARIDRALPPGSAAGTRYAPQAMQALNR